ncbi:MAG TPA: hypothetical protein VLK82_07445 [Candidatus Tectomicrobia bacterium]|nr:hypothetical protein [Candidatus Tectomicrobia bacterium]
MHSTPFDMAHDLPVEDAMTELTLTKETTPAPAPAAGEYPMSTLCLRLDVDGVGLSWTLRGEDADVASRLPRILEYIKKLQAKLPRPEPARPVAVPAAPLEAREDWCAIHGVAMASQSNERGSWWSHRLPEGGYCKGRRRKAGA